MTDASPRRSGFEKLQTIARALLLIYVPGLLYAGLVTVGAFAYGLAHASGGAVFGFIAGVGGVILFFIAVPLLLLMPGLSPGIKVLKSIAMLVLAVGLFIVGKALWYTPLEPAYMTARFNYAMKALSIAGIKEQPLLIDGTVIGLRLTVSVRSSRSLKMDRYGKHALDFFSSPGVYLAKVEDGSRRAALQPGQLLRVTFDGKPVKPQPDAELPAGIYSIERDFLLDGLHHDPEGVPCSLDEPVIAQTLKDVRSTSGKTLVVLLGVRFALRDRLGYRHFQRESEPLRFRYDAASWPQQITQLPVERCSALTAKRQAAEKAAARARFEVQYAAGDQTLSGQNNPLYEDLCAGNLAPLRERLAAGAPRYKMAGTLTECGIRRPRPELFQLVMPVLFAQSARSADYCDVLHFLHGNRAIPFLQQLSEMNLPLFCDGERRKDWRAGITPFDANGSVINYPPLEESLRWLKVLVKAGVPVCEPVPGEGTLLSLYVNHGPAQLVELLLKAGCDPRLKPRRLSSIGGREPAVYSPQVWWAIRRFIAKPYENLADPIDAGSSRTINPLMGEVSASEINEPDPKSGRTFLHDYGYIAIRDPQLLMYLISRGARLDTASHAPSFSWYSPGRFRSDNNSLIEKPMLDLLSREQLQRLITPQDSLDGSPGAPMDEVENFSEAGLGRYLCRRGVITCPPSAG